MANPFRLFFLKRRRVQRRDFSSSKQAVNPLFVKRRGKGVVWSGIALTAVLIAGGAYLISSPRFRITEIRIEGAIRIEPNSVQQFIQNRLDRSLFGVHWQRVIFLVPLGAITKELRSSIEHVVSLERVSIKRQNWNGLTVSLVERTPSLVWSTMIGSSYFLDDHGVIVEQIKERTPQHFAVLHDTNGLAPVIGLQVVQPSFVNALHQLQEQLPTMDIRPKSYSTWEAECPPPEQPKTVPNSNVRTNSDTEVQEEQVANQTPSNESLRLKPSVSCDETLRAVNEPTIVVQTDEGWDIFIDTSVELGQQLQKLRVALAKSTGTRRSQLRYVDVRFGDRVFYQ